MKKVRMLAAMFAVAFYPLGVQELLADEGRIPIFGTITISQAGHYILTRDIPDPAAPAANVITIAADNVSVDLNGRTISPAAGAAGISITAPRKGITVLNGRIVGGAVGIISGSGLDPVSIRIESVEVAGQSSNGIIINNGGYVEVIGCHVHDVGAVGINVANSATSFGGRFIGNTLERITNAGISLNGLLAGEVRGNFLKEFGSVAGGVNGIQVSEGAGVNAGGNLVAANVVSSLPSGTDDSGIVIATTSPNNLLIENVVTRNGSRGIRSLADGTRLERNVANQNGSHGIEVGLGATGAFNHLEENQAQRNLAAGACGIFFTNGNSHTYRNNNTRGNTIVGPTAAACGGGLGTNMDAGGNITAP
ncbi:MAG TPA: right-handed parallel beta-helix repeat-containing protein [Candidatus Polarisedimenticolia bacterium]|jgi:hypothetical protein|nr:right-handed parallel beta-helix repeat-containing protein [Candidatus Polarisedimenticolia bacterium]